MFASMLDPNWEVFLKESAILQGKWCLGCFALSFLLSYLCPILIGKSYKDLPNGTKAAWTNRGVAATQAVVMFSHSMYYFFVLNPYPWIIETVVSPYQAWLLDIMMGYMLYDVVADYALTGDLLITAHHLMGYVSHISTRLTNIGPIMFYTMMVFMAEGSTPFVHSLWFLHTLKLNEIFLFKFLSAMLLLSFFVLRVIGTPFSIIHYTTNASIVDQWAQQPVLYWFNDAILVLFGSLNFFWFYKLIKLALKPPKKGGKVVYSVKEM